MTGRLISRIVAWAAGRAGPEALATVLTAVVVVIVVVLLAVIVLASRG